MCKQPRMVYVCGLNGRDPGGTLSRAVYVIYNSRGDMFLLVVGYIRGNFSPVPARRCFSGWLRVYPREIFSCTRAAILLRPIAGISARFSLLYPRGGVFPAGCGYIRGKSSPVPARRCFSGRLRVYPREIFSCTRAAMLLRPVAGISAGNLLLYPRGGVFPAGCGYIRGNFSPVPAHPWHKSSAGTLSLGCTQRLLKSVSDGLSTGVCKQPRMAYVCALNGPEPGGTLSRAVFFSYYTTLFFL